MVIGFFWLLTIVYCLTRALQSVEVCLKHGARIDVRQNDQATAFHLAASQGTLSIVKAMFDSHRASCPDDYIEILHARDILQMTPLHRAAMFDHPEVVRYLIEQVGCVKTCDASVCGSFNSLCRVSGE